MDQCENYSDIQAELGGNHFILIVCHLDVLAKSDVFEYLHTP